MVFIHPDPGSSAVEDLETPREGFWNTIVGMTFFKLFDVQIWATLDHVGFCGKPGGQIRHLAWRNCVVLQM